MAKLTKTEEGLLRRVRDCNAQGALAGLSIAPEDFTKPAFEGCGRFVRRLHASGAIVWVESPVFGKGWALPENVIFDPQGCPRFVDVTPKGS